MSDKKQSIGALWSKLVNNKLLLSGSIEIEGKTYKLAIWTNDYKKEAKHPDYKIYLDTYEGKGITPPNAANNTASHNTVSTGQITNKTFIPDSENLPF
jgi:hypothetical protein